MVWDRIAKNIAKEQTMAIKNSQFVMLARQKIKPKLIQIKTHKNNSYRGDKSLQIQAVMENGIVGLMNITPFYDKGKKIYENDVNSYLFDTITEAKQWCKEKLLPLAY